VGEHVGREGDQSMTNLNPCIDPEKIAFYREIIQSEKAHLADCEARRPTKCLRDLMVHWAGTEDIDFNYLAGIIRYGLEEHYDCLRKAKRGWSLMCFAK
jgi:hypothetical protein